MKRIGSVAQLVEQLLSIPRAIRLNYNLTSEISMKIFHSASINDSKRGWECTFKVVSYVPIVTFLRFYLLYMIPFLVFLLLLKRHCLNEAFNQFIASSSSSFVQFHFYASANAKNNTRENFPNADHKNVLQVLRIWNPSLPWAGFKWSLDYCRNTRKTKILRYISYVIKITTQHTYLAYYTVQFGSKTHNVLSLRSTQ